MCGVGNVGEMWVNGLCSVSVAARGGCTDALLPHHHNTPPAALATAHTSTTAQAHRQHAVQGRRRVATHGMRQRLGCVSS